MVSLVVVGYIMSVGEMQWQRLLGKAVVIGVKLVSEMVFELRGHFDIELCGWS